MTTSELVQQLQTPWTEHKSTIWLASTVTIHRNIDKFLFPSKLDQERRGHIVELLRHALTGSNLLQNPKLYKFVDVNPLDREYVLEHFLLFEKELHPHQGEAFIINGCGELLCLVNLKDHIELHALNITQDPERSWQQLNEIEEALEKNIKFAFSDEFGYLTADPFIVGTGLVISSFLHIPALILSEGLSDIMAEEKHEAISIVNIQGSKDSYIGHIAVLKNRFTLGLNEEIIISAIHKSSLRLQALEKAARRQLKEEKSDIALDKVSRALGTLKSCYSIGTSEALNALSWIILGAELGWVQGLGVDSLQELFFHCRRAHLAESVGSSFITEDAHKIRAEFLRDRCSALTFSQAK